MKTSDWKRVGTIAVDSGSITIVDPCYVGDMPERVAATCEAREVLFSGIVGTGVNLSTGFGDGAYPCYVKYLEEDDGWGPRIVEVKVVFITPEELEDEDD